MSGPRILRPSLAAALLLPFATLAACGGRFTRDGGGAEGTGGGNVGGTDAVGSAGGADTAGADAAGGANPSGGGGTGGTLVVGCPTDTVGSPASPVDCDVPSDDPSYCDRCEFLLGELRLATTGAGPVAVATGDFDDDGRLDLITANQTDDTVSLLLGNGDGTFQPKADHEIGASPRAIVVGDLNGDGKLDAATANTDRGTVSVLLGCGDGTLVLSGEYATGADPEVLVIGDLNGDRKADLVTANAGAETLDVLLATGEGELLPGVEYETRGRPMLLVLGDLNGDGSLDLAVTNGSDFTHTAVDPPLGVATWLGRGDGTFADRTDVDLDIDLYNITYADWLVAGDLDGDDQVDLALGASHGYEPTFMQLLIGDGDGAFSSHLDFSLGLEFALAADLNVDGQLDLLGTTPPADRGIVVLGPLGETLTTTGEELDVPLAVGDFDENGIPDLALVRTSSASVSMRFGIGDGTFWTPRDRLPQASRFVGDLDGDGALDMITPSGVDLGNGDGTFRPTSEQAFGSSDVLDLGDLDGDELPDVVTQRDGEELAIWLNDGTGSFGPAATGTVDGSQTALMAKLADLNGDGELDLLTADYDSVDTLRGVGDGTFSHIARYDVPTHYLWALGDLNGDGNPDLLAGSDDAGSLTIRLGVGDGTLDSPQQFESTLGGWIFGVALGDVDGDGDLDLVAAADPPMPSGGPTEVAIALNQGDGAFEVAGIEELRVPHLLQYFEAPLKLGDLNGDGHLDLVASSDGSTNVMLGAGDGTFYCSLLFDVGANSFTLADMNGDGRLDFVGRQLALNTPQ